MILRLLGSVMCLHLVIGIAFAEDVPEHNPPAWLDEVQTYCMMPILPESAVDLGISVNGVWGGVGSDNPILREHEPLRKAFGDDVAAYVQAAHDAGLLVSSIVYGIEEPPPSLRKIFPELSEMACRLENGKLREAVGLILMCTNNPDWVEWEIAYGKRGIDNGADMILVDTPMGASFVSGGFLKGGFCPSCMARFTKHMTDTFTADEMLHRFGLKALEVPDLIKRLSSRQIVGPPDSPRAFRNSEPDDLLFREFIRCQEQGAFETRRTLANELRRYAREKNRAVAICTNGADLGSQNPFDHWVRGLMFADLFDMFAYELGYMPQGLPKNELGKLPRAKWAPYHKLAHAVHGRRAPAALHTGAMRSVIEQAIQKRSPANAALGVQCAEAYAANGAYMPYFITPETEKVFIENVWAGVIESTRFVSSHKDLFEGDLKTGSDVAVLFLFNERGRVIPAVFPSYLGLAQTLIEGSYPFEVVFAGDDHYVKDRLRVTDLVSYRTLFLPSPIDPTDNQKRVVQDFVKGGGTLVCQEPERLGIPLEEAKRLPSETLCVEGRFPYGDGTVVVMAGKVTSTWTDDAASNYFQTGDEKWRRQIEDLAKALGLKSVLDRKSDGLVSAFPILQPEKKHIIVHLVNYDVDYSNDRVREKTDIAVRISRPDFLTGPVEGLWYAPGLGEPERIVVDASGDTLSCVVPRLDTTGALVLGP